MPEQLTKFPDVTLQVLRSAGARCGEAAPQSILTKCPAERFCRLPGGELCIYGLEEAPAMTQVSASDWQVLQHALAARGAFADSPAGGPGFVAAGAAFLVGLLLGAIVTRLKRR